MFKKKMLTAAVAMACSLIAGQAAAGAATGPNLSMGVLVQQENGSNWNLSLANLMNFNATTGAVTLDSSRVAAPVSDALGQWSLLAAGAVDIDGSTALATDRIKWHSWERADGTIGATSTDANPWTSVFSFTAGANVDPFMTYGFSAKNNSAGLQTYTFGMGESLVPVVAGSYSVSADVSGALANRSGSGVSITPAFADQDGDSLAELQVLRLSNDGGLTFANAGVDVGLAASYPGTGNHLYGTYADTKNGSGNFNYWAVETKFTLTGGQDIASLAGTAEIIQIAPVPEPEQSGMVLAGLGLIGFIARRRLGIA